MMFSRHEYHSNIVGGVVKFGWHLGMKGRVAHSMFAR